MHSHILVSGGYVSGLALVQSRLAGSRCLTERNITHGAIRRASGSTFS